MSISSISQSNVLGEDVLQMIFQELDAEDLLKCEAVCRQWRDILLAATPWRRLYHRNIGRLRLWRKARKNFELDQKTLRTEQYRGICKNILQQVNRNWRRGHFAKLTFPVSSRCANQIFMNEDYVAWNISCYAPYFPNNCLDRGVCAFLDTESMEKNEILTYFGFPEQVGTIFSHSSEMLVYHWNVSHSNIEIVNGKTRWAVNYGDGLDEKEKNYLGLKFGSKLLVTYCQFFDSDRGRIRIWKMGNPSVLLRDRSFSTFGLKLELVKVDEWFIVLRSSTTFYFISAETFEEIRTVSWWVPPSRAWEYNRRLLFQSFYPFNDNMIIRILDVASGTFFSDVRLPSRYNTEGSVELMYPWATSNSRFMVIGWKYLIYKTFKISSHLSFYDLEAVKKPSSDRSCYLYTLQFQFELRRFVMDESRIVFTGIPGNDERNVTVLDFADFVERKTSDLEDSDLEDKPETQMKIIFGPFVDY
jgi:F-box-like